MLFEGDNNVITAIKEKKRQMDAAEPHDHIRPLLTASGGLMKGAYGLGVMQALQDQGLHTCFTDVVGVSSGALSAAYFLLGQTEQATSLAANEAVSGEFIHPKNLYSAIDTQFLRRVLEGSTGKRLDIETLQALPTNFYVGVSEWATGKPALLKSVDTEETLEAMRATVAMPGVVSDKVYVQGVRYVDGESTSPYILGVACDTVKPTHALVLTNQEKGDLDIHWLDKYMTLTLYRFRMTRALRTAAVNRRINRRIWIDSARETKEFPIGFSWGNDSIASYEPNGQKILETVETIRQEWNKLLS